MEKDKGD